MTLALARDEILELTHRTRPHAQLRHLRRMGIRAERRPDGSVLVLRAWLAERPESAAQSRPRPRLKSDDQKTPQTGLSHYTGGAVTHEFPKLRTIAQLAAELAPSNKGIFSQQSLRWMVFQAESNGLEVAIIRIGRRVLIDAERFNQWLEQQRARSLRG